MRGNSSFTVMRVRSPPGTRLIIFKGGGQDPSWNRRRSDVGINITDLTGQLRSDQDLQEALDAATREMVSRSMGNPELKVMLPTIIECLRELQDFRKLVKKIKSNLAKEKQAGG